MDNMIERYVYDVARRLPEKEREEVKKELRANIYDMLPDGASEEQIKKVLYELGSPVSLAEKYRQKPKYLISPAYYDEYVSVLKWVLPLVGVLVMVIGFAIGAFDAVKAGTNNYAMLMSGVISKGVSMGLSAAFQVLVWTTIGFVIAERSGDKAEKGGAPSWKIEDLPEVQQDEKARIPLSESIAQLIVITVFSILGLLFCAGKLPFAMAFSDGGTHFYTIFSESFLALLIPVILISLAFGVIETVAKIRDRRWTPFVCAAVVIKQLIDMAMTLYVVNQPNILSAEFRSFLMQTEVNEVLHILPSVNGTNALVIAFCVLVIIGAIAESIKAIQKTVRTKGK